MAGSFISEVKKVETCYYTNLYIVHIDKYTITLSIHIMCIFEMKLSKPKNMKLSICLFFSF